MTILICLVYSSFHGILQLTQTNLISGMIDVILVFWLFARYSLTSFRTTFVKITPVFILMSIFTLWVTLISIYSGIQFDLFFVGLTFKDYLLPLLAFFIFSQYFNGFNLSENTLDIFLIVMAIGISFVGLISLLNYFFDFSSSFPRFVVKHGFDSVNIDENSSYVRYVMGIPIVRMNSLFALSTQAAPSVLYCLAIYVSLVYRKVSKKLLLLCVTINIACIFFSVSFTAIIALAVLLLLHFILNSKMDIMSILTVILASFLSIYVILTVRISIDESTQLSVLEYGYEYFWEKFSVIFERIDIKSFFLGFGPMPRLYFNEFLTYEQVRHYSNVIYDNSIFGLLFQFGVISLVLMLLIFSFVLFKCRRSNAPVFKIAAVCILSMLSFAHGFFLIERIFILKAAFLLAIFSIGSKVNVYQSTDNFGNNS
ncbi:hypothetical protein WB532_003734 [Vibrio vulnificus]